MSNANTNARLYTHKNIPKIECKMNIQRLMVRPNWAFGSDDDQLNERLDILEKINWLEYKYGI